MKDSTGEQDAAGPEHGSTHVVTEEPTHDRRTMPAIGCATVFSPGRNFATKSELAPRLMKRFSVFLTQESGSIEMRHNRFKMRLPCVRPSWNHIRSLRKAPEKVRNSRT